MNSCSRCTVGFLLLGYALADADKGKEIMKLADNAFPNDEHPSPFSKTVVMMMNGKKTCSSRSPNLSRDEHTTMKKRKQTSPILQVFQISISLALFCMFVFFSPLAATRIRIKEASVD
jgi:hypothetical protein